MRIVTYNGVAVKRQKKIGPNAIKVTFYGDLPIVVTPEEWERNSRNQYFDDPTAKRCEVVRLHAVAR